MMSEQTLSDHPLRSGTPWQQSPKTSTHIRTMWRTLCHPVRTFDTMQLEQPRKRLGLRARTLLLAALIPYLLHFYFVPISISGAIEDAGTFYNYHARQLINYAILFPVGVLSIWLGLELLLWVQSHGMALVSRWLGGGLSPRGARVALDHAAAWWVVAALGGTVSMFLRIGTDEIWYPHAVWFTRVAFLFPMIGLLGFECYALIALVRLKIANTPRPESPEPTNPPSPDS